MSEQLILKNLPFIKILPAWAQELSYKYCSKTANLYILHGNIRDLLPHKMNEGEFIFARIQEYVSEVLFGNRDIIVFYDRSSGVSFCEAVMEAAYIKTMKSRYPDVTDDELLSQDPEKSFFYLEKYFLMKIQEKKRIVFIMDYAETIVPAGELIRLSDEDRYCLVTLNRWSNDPIFTKGDVSIILLTENLTDISPRLTGSPSTVKVEIPIPDEDVRASFLESMERQGKLLLDRGLVPRRMAAGAQSAKLKQACFRKLPGRYRAVARLYRQKEKRDYRERSGGAP